MKITRRQLRQIIKEAVDRDMSYKAVEYIPGFETIQKQLVAMVNEVLPIEFGTYTELIHRESADALSSIELVLATLKELTVEYKDMGGMVGRLSPASKTMNIKTGEFLKEALDDELLHSDIVDSVYDTIADTARLNIGRDRENIVLTGIDNELESREEDGEEVNMTQIDLQKVFQDVMAEIEKEEQQKIKDLERRSDPVSDRMEDEFEAYLWSQGARPKSV